LGADVSIFAFFGKINKKNLMLFIVIPMGDTEENGLGMMRERLGKGIRQILRLFKT
jgi:hypothetical protein